ncbi:LysE family translocator [Agromyces binzhouensis]|uniref:LysE family translocator n=1 Tax=Agromyces binzhouensis TaxID=1817495 RepID=A0A4Q2JGT5_9MICO|nr:LysE family translocator [Agromyces binzhouensis]RXZ45964.1 LysE family translocator [Agromyces binzhouensis]
MVPASNLWAFVLASVVLIVIPGPSVLFVIGRSLALGRMGGLLSVVGNAVGMLPLVAAVALGVGTVVAQSVALFTAIKLGGALYLVYLGVQAIRHRADAADAVTRQVAARSPWRLLGEGVVVGVTNPKTIAFFVAVLPQFVDFHAGAIPMQMAMLGTAFVVLALACDSVWALAAGTARDWFARSPRRASHLAATGGVMMIGLGGVLALSGNEH